MSTDHLRFSGADAATQRDALEAIIRQQPVLMMVLAGLRDMALPDHLLVAGAIYNQVWNHLTGRPDMTGVNDIDVFYFDDSDIGWDAEDKVIKACDIRFAGLGLPIQVRNQARVHLWFEDKFGSPFSPLTSSAEMLGRYASRTHAVGVRLDAADRMEIVAPFGLDDLFSFRMVPNPVLDNRISHTSKGERAKAIWPELTVIPWPE
ncbi:nucleotidyltransferase family protein [Devosia sp.]|uniref:nucleotidyltransferase family protein n=1 Tax=Devosia sp. TaxID=1871048 RepID=UPI0019F0452A|nr:nucleotidyltransferase family protein [Devosia sp.]MBE0578831.1 nucleotidyltransferase family protein [Devosia sp.]